MCDGSAVVHGSSSVSFSFGSKMFSYTFPTGEWHDEWYELAAPSKYTDFTLAVVRDKLTAVGGWQSSLSRDVVATNTLLCLYRSGSGTVEWGEIFPPMPTARAQPAVVTTSTHLIVACGVARTLGPYNMTIRAPLSVIEIMDIVSLQWFSANNSPQPMQPCCMTVCDGFVYLSEHNTIFSCPLDELLKSCKSPSTKHSDDSSMWSKLMEIPQPFNSQLTTLAGQVLAIGGSTERHKQSPISAIHCYNRATNRWSVIGELSSPMFQCLVVVLPSNQLLLMGEVAEGQRCRRIVVISSPYEIAA